MSRLSIKDLTEDISRTVRQALAEDIGSGDLSAQLIPATQMATARVITREPAIVCGTAWVDEVFRQLGLTIPLTWQVVDSQAVAANQLLLEVFGPARTLLSGERAALNLLQTLSGIATRCQTYADLVVGSSVRLLDTRKTIPGLRLAQKYAVSCGGCYNHRLGLYDAFLIKENHIAACGGITQAVAAARALGSGRPVEVEVENLQEFREALAAGADIIMLDELSLEEMRTAVGLNAGRAQLEASGGINVENLHSIAQTGVDYISLGTLTKDLKAIDLSMRLYPEAS